MRRRGCTSPSSCLSRQPGHRLFSGLGVAALAPCGSPAGRRAAGSARTARATCSASRAGRDARHPEWLDECATVLRPGSSRGMPAVIVQSAQQAGSCAPTWMSSSCASTSRSPCKAVRRARQTRPGRATRGAAQDRRSPRLPGRPFGVLQGASYPGCAGLREPPLRKRRTLNGQAGFLEEREPCAHETRPASTSFALRARQPALSDEVAGRRQTLA